MNYLISMAELGKDIEKVVSFWKTNFDNWPEDKIHWFYEKNPEGEAICWKLEDDVLKMIIGTLVIFPRKFYINGDYTNAAITGDFGVDKKHRLLLPALKLQKACINYQKETQFDFLYGFPNKKSLPVQLRSGFTNIGEVVRLTKIYDFQFHISNYVKNKKLTFLISKLVNPASRLFTKETYSTFDRGYQSEETTRFDERFDELWKNSKKDIPVVGERSSKYLNWRYSDCPYRNYKIFVVKQKKSPNIIGFVVFLLRDDDLYIYDIFARDTEKKYEIVLSKFLRHVRKLNIVTIFMLYFGSEKIIKIFKKYMFMKRRTSRNFVIHTNPGIEHEVMISKKENWYFCEGDKD